MAALICAAMSERLKMLDAFAARRLLCTGNTDSTMVKGDINITYRSETVVDLFYKRPFQKSLWEEMEGKTEIRISRWGIEGHDMPLYNIIYRYWTSTAIGRFV